MPDAQVSIRGLSRAFDGTKAVVDLSLSIGSGEIFGLLGPNGAGKTTTVHMLVGLLRPDSGTIDICGRGGPEKPEVRMLLGIAPQALALYDSLTARENILFFGKVMGLPAAKLASAADEVLGLVGLKDRENDRVKGFSGGMKRRLNLAVGLVHQPSVLLLDEPTAGVDPQSRNAILENVRALKEHGHTIIYTTHYMEEAEKLCDRVAIIDHGKLLALGTVEELVAAHGGESTIQATTDQGSRTIQTGEPMKELNELWKHGSLRTFTLRRPDLETVFLNLTGRNLRDQ